VRLDARIMLFLTLVGVFLTSLLLGNLIAGKVAGFSVAGHDVSMSAGAIPFPLTFILTDILNEFYGRRVVRRVTFLGFAMTALAFLMLLVAAALPWMPAAHEPGWQGLPPSAWNSVFTGATQIQIASMVAYLVGQLLDISLFFAIKKWTGDRALWLRATGSTLVSQLIDSTLVTMIGFSALPMAVQLDMIQAGYLIKVVSAIALTPVLYGLHALIERTWGIEPVPLERA
jgi:uncharacterized integral membrane protein (TIGR00697 family)